MTSRIPVHALGATGTRNGTTALHGDGTWRVPGGGSGGALTHATLGATSAGASVATLTTHRVYLKQVTVASAGLLTDIQAHISQTVAGKVNSLSSVLFADAAGQPGEVLTVNAQRLTSLYLFRGSRWLGLPVGRWVSPGNYWLGVACSDIDIGIGLHYDSPGSDLYYTANGARIGDGHNGSQGWANTNAGVSYSLRASIVS